MVLPGSVQNAHPPDLPCRVIFDGTTWLGISPGRYAFQPRMGCGPRRVAQVLILSVMLAIFWLACVADLNPHDMILGAPAVILSVAFSFFTIRSLPIRFRPLLNDLFQVWRLPWYIFSDLAQISWVLMKDFTGQPAASLFRSVPWGPVADNGMDTAKRTLAVAYTTAAPNFMVVGIDAQRGQMLFHQVQKSRVPIMTQRLGAGSGY
ncbi:MAG: hypothetical protein WCC27_05365 [Acidobacteriaceae bacterium]